MKKLILIMVLFMAPVSLLQAEVISIIDVDSANMQVEKPKSGLTMAQVKQQFGQPEQESGPVGQPPITTWVYPDFSVYFEYDRVIYAVATPRK